MGTPIRRIRVLCVDDNRDAAETMGLLLGLLGFDTRVAYDGPSALAAAEEFRPDVCLLDVNMPVMDGNELAGRLRGRFASRPLLLVACTARSGDADRDRTSAAGFHHHLIKPVDVTTLLGVMGEFTRSRWAADRPREEAPAAAAATSG